MEPSGRLTISVPRNVAAAPYFYNHKFKSAGTPIARHFGSDYPFGHGLSYTSFAFEDLRMAAREVPVEGGEVSLSFTLRNIGARAGTAVPQLYVRDRLASVVRPVKELKGFGRVTLAPGEARRVTFHLPTDMLSFTGMDHRRRVEPGAFELMIGASSGDIALSQTVTLTGDVRILTGAWRMLSRMEIGDTIGAMA